MKPMSWSEFEPRRPTRSTGSPSPVLPTSPGLDSGSRNRMPPGWAPISPAWSRNRQQRHAFSAGRRGLRHHHASFMELVAVGKDISLSHKPAQLSFEQAAAVPVAALTALQALRDKGSVEEGQHVLVNGAAGGAGTFTVQIAKALGAEVTAVCSSRNVEMVAALGADDVIDYTRGDFTKGPPRYELMIDLAGSRSWSHVKLVLRPRYGTRSREAGRHHLRRRSPIFGLVPVRRSPFARC